MTCAIYRCTAHVSHLYQSSDPAQPCVFHGNTCAHDMNVISTASVLPRTPDHVNQMLSVVFIGPGKYKKDCLKNMFRIRKHKVWDFLVTVWLKDGRVVSKTIDNKVTGWLGSKNNPPTREQRLKKFFACTRHALAEDGAKRMLALVEQLENLPDVREIMFELEFYLTFEREGRRCKGGQRYREVETSFRRTEILCTVQENIIHKGKGGS